MFSSYKRLDCYSLLQQDPLPGVEVHVVKAERSDRWSKHELQQLGELAKQSERVTVSMLAWRVQSHSKDAVATRRHGHGT